MTPEQAYLERAIDRFAPTVAATARASLKRLREMFPGAHLLVYDRRQSLPIGFAPATGGSAIFSVVVYPRWVRFFFLEGIALDDPQGRLEGTGNQVRSLRIDENALLFSDPYVQALIVQTISLSGKDLSSGDGAVVIKSRVASQPPRRATTRAKKKQGQ